MLCLLANMKFNAEDYLISNFHLKKQNRNTVFHHLCETKIASLSGCSFLSSCHFNFCLMQSTSAPITSNSQNLLSTDIALHKLNVHQYFITSLHNLRYEYFCKMTSRWVLNASAPPPHTHISLQRLLLSTLYHITVLINHAWGNSLN